MSDLKAIQARSLEMAEYFVAFCKEHDLLCYLCGGGAIGALRNKGFIPWDDDLDFFMPRKDYEKLAELWPRYADERYFLSKSNKDFVDRNLFITIVTRKLLVSSLIKGFGFATRFGLGRFYHWIIILKIQLSVRNRFVGP